MLFPFSIADLPQAIATPLIAAVQPYISLGCYKDTGNRAVPTLEGELPSTCILFKFLDSNAQVATNFM